jgi:polar amino acid transport system substrate-binding protein
MADRKFLPNAAAFLAMVLLSAVAHAQDRVAIPTQAADPRLRAKLPKEILDAGELVAVNSGSFPPYDIIGDDQVLAGASADLETAVGELLGIHFQNKTVSGLAGVLGGIKAGRYQLDMGPDGDFPDRETANDFIDWVREYVVFAVPKGNPKQINDITDTCGLRIAVQSGGSAEQVIKKQSATCTEAGKPAVEVQSYGDQPTALLAVRSGRSDAFFSSQAPLTYFVHETNGQLELAAIGKPNGFGAIYQGTVVQKGSPLGPVLLESYQILFHDGTYAAIMRKWHLEGNMIPEPGLDLATARKP